MNETLTLPTGTLTISVVDSHTGGEPTRVVIDGFPALTGTDAAESAAPTSPGGTVDWRRRSSTSRGATSRWSPPC